MLQFNCNKYFCRKDWQAQQQNTIHNYDGKEVNTTKASIFSATKSTSSIALSEPVIKLIFLLLGVGVLVPWNAFVSAKPYFQSRFCSTGKGTSTIITNSGDNVEFLFAVIYNVFAMISLASVIIIGWYDNSNKKNVNKNKQSSTSTFFDSSGDDDNIQIATTTNTNNDNNHPYFMKVMISLFIFVFVFIITALLVMITNIPTNVFKFITLVGLAACGVCQGLAQAGIVAAAGNFPSYIGINPLLSGMAVGGVFVSGTNFIASILDYGSSSTYWNSHCFGVIDSNSNHHMTPAASIILATTQNNIDIIQQPLEPESLKVYENPLLNDHDHARLLSSTLNENISSSSCVPYTSIDMAVFIYFLLGGFTLVLCLFGYYLIHKVPRNQIREGCEAVANEGGKMQEILIIDTNAVSKQSTFQRENVHNSSLELVLEDKNNNNIYDDENHYRSLADDSSPLLKRVGTNTTKIVKTNYLWDILTGPALAIYLDFSITLALFPVWTSELRSVNECQEYSSRLSNDLYTPLTFVLFNIGDLSGRMVAGKMNEFMKKGDKRTISYKLVIAALMRLMFFPLILSCYSGDDKGWLSHSGIYSLVVQSLFAFSNGMIVSLSFMHGPNMLSDSHSQEAVLLQERSSQILMFALTFGLLTGSLLSKHTTDFF